MPPGRAGGPSGWNGVRRARRVRGCTCDCTGLCGDGTVQCQL
ncbi:hypothetical protein KCH_06050 [Kitasatospora cheerisanensis KCTC 2395]|uniref:Uncharacterized protein n=1 Tax=Kitasatospora cheerisanensis KCTC 2395 TaxID=1348663 RepID=A0A066Z1I1_9ACTN|nr:hypothetical protein KCH_06050 [Kitasatospora cheerisanensis KCTC 2395]